VKSRRLAATSGGRRRHCHVRRLALASSLVGLLALIGACQGLVGADFGDDLRLGPLSTTDAAQGPVTAEADGGGTTTPPSTSPDGGGGGGTPKPGCIPQCANKECGAADGCDGLCDGTCAQTGLRCVAGVCKCDATSCSKGCCAPLAGGGEECRAGRARAACGKGGAACESCTGTKNCVEQTCRSPGIGCHDHAAGVTPTCSSICASLGRVCGQGCFAASPTTVGQIYNAAACGGSAIVNVATCAEEVETFTGESAGCCCL
jgi:hypothetical protein